MTRDRLDVACLISFSSLREALYIAWVILYKEIALHQSDMKDFHYLASVLSLALDDCFWV